MAQQERIEKTKTERKTESSESNTTDAKKVDAAKLKASLDAIIDEIDEVLDAEAEQMVAQFIQKGGQ